MPKSNQSNRGGGRDSSSRSSNGVMEMARERPMAAAATAAAAVGAGVFLWNRRNQISDQISQLGDQISEWTDSMRSGSGNSSMMDDTAGLTTAGDTGTAANSRTRSTTGSRSTGTRGRSSTGSRNRGMSETGGGNASLGAHSGDSRVSRTCRAMS